MQSTETPDPQPTPTQVGTPDEQTQHRPSAPTPTEHNAAMAQRPNDCVGRR
jgi:hypothetical protein